MKFENVQHVAGSLSDIETLAKAAKKAWWRRTTNVFLFIALSIAAAHAALAVDMLIFDIKNPELGVAFMSAVFIVSGAWSSLIGAIEGVTIFEFKED